MPRLVVQVADSWNESNDSEDTLQLGRESEPGLATVRAPSDLCLAVSVGGPFEVIAIADEEVSIGRSRDNAIRIEDPSISRHHAVLQTTPVVRIKDLGSANGVSVRGQRLVPGEYCPVRVGDLIEMGAAMVVVRRLSAVQRPRRIWTHGYFEGRLEEECARRDRQGGEFAILRVGITGQADAARIEESFANTLRAVDVLARYAPGEYEVLLVDATPDQAAAASDRVLDAIVESANVDRSRIRAAITSYPRDGHSAEHLLAHSYESVRPPVLARGGKLRYARGEVRDQIERVARSELSVLITGETGVGKEVCAEAIHELSHRSGGRLLRMNCAALSETLLEGELFGYERGSFTGAVRSKPGLLETANGGTVFLDELGDMPLSTQVKLLRVIEERRVQRIGSLEPKAIDVRFLGATNKDLEAEVAARRFRQDLYFRLNAFSIHIPPLRERVAEIAPLARQFINETVPDGQPAPAISADALRQLESYQWPGNIRELKNIIQRAVVLAGSGPILVEHLPIDKMHATLLPTPRALFRDSMTDDPDAFEPRPTAPFARVPGDLVGNLPLSMAPDDDSERAAVIEALRQCGGNQSKAAKLLGVSRGTLISRLDKYGIPRPRKRRNTQ